MSANIFDFWADLPADTKVHPADLPIFKRLGDGTDTGHGFNLKCLPVPFAGPLRTAPIVLLYLSAGLADQDLNEAESHEAQARQTRQRRGDSPLPSEDDIRVHGHGGRPEPNLSET
ncbi:hypothetical protein ACELLULO517_19260 [Acidisoma cellulosilytica]|uniref:Uncharacterized protein n=1 Tax=Acidisoma cellulosilyticum TaxID=2802395 RepID=A0A963Z5E3_9PROT|nr:hypothetical protein [Acidisoma cellulosilyticum]MCB8882395.1 hypothetical protein [Acidisoma cellulosilyticum]